MRAESGIHQSGRNLNFKNVLKHYKNVKEKHEVIFCLLYEIMVSVKQLLTKQCQRQTNVTLARINS